MLEPVSVALKFAFLAVLYLFLLWVARSALKDLRRDRGEDAVVVGAPPPPSDATSMHQAAEGLGPDPHGGEPRLVVQRAQGHESGEIYELVRPVTLGRGNVEIKLEDPFASSRHARIERQGGVVFIEDLGSTNGTYLNDEPLNGPQPLHPGDRIRIGDSEFSYVQ